MIKEKTFHADAHVTQNTAKATQEYTSQNINFINERGRYPYLSVLWTLQRRQDQARGTGLFEGLCLKVRTYRFGVGSTLLQQKLPQNIHRAHLHQDYGSLRRDRQNNDKWQAISFGSCRIRKNVPMLYTCAVKNMNFLGGSMCWRTSSGGSPWALLCFSMCIAESPIISSIAQAGLSRGRILWVSAK